MCHVALGLGDWCFFFGNVPMDTCSQWVMHAIAESIRYHLRPANSQRYLAVEEPLSKEKNKPDFLKSKFLLSVVVEYTTVRKLFLGVKVVNYQETIWFSQLSTELRHPGCSMTWSLFHRLIKTVSRDPYCKQKGYLTQPFRNTKQKLTFYFTKYVITIYHQKFIQVGHWLSQLLTWRIIPGLVSD